MFSDIHIKREIEDNSYNEIDSKKDINLLKNFCPNISSTTEPPKKLLKTEDEISGKFDKIKSELYLKTESNINNNKNIDIKSLDKNVDKCDTNQKKSLTYDLVLQELFSWNPEWLQGRALNKPPLKKVKEELVENPFRLDYSRDEYICRHLPYIESEIFIKLSDSFKNEAPSRIPHQMFINDCDNSGDLGLNKILVCYAVRDVRQDIKSIARVNDIVIISLEVMQTNCKKISKKHYFGLITGHSMLELHELELKVLEKFETQTVMDMNIKTFLFWDKFVILTKRSRESSILSKRMAQMEVVINASLELRSVENLLYGNWKCSKLLNNIFNANANINQFSAQELTDCRTVRRTLSLKAIDMINKSNPMVFYKGANNLMVVDISDSSERLKCLCDIIIESIESFCRNNAKIRFLVITKSDETSVCWRERLRDVCGNKSPVKVWSLDSSRGWTQHEEIKRFTKNNAKRIHESCGTKLRHLTERQSESYIELVRRKSIYQQLMKTCVTNRSDRFLLPSIHIAKEELIHKGFENLLNESNVIVGTFYNIINSQLLFKDPIEPFDCCIIDDSHTLPEVNIFSSIHFGIKCMIIGGDSEGTAVCTNPIAKDQKFDISLFNRIFLKCFNSM